MLETAAPETRTVDPFIFEIISHRLFGITKEVAATLERLGGTVNTTQRHDYITALYRGNGDVLCAGESSLWHVVCAGRAVKEVIKRFQDDEGINPGDSFMLNDPYVAAIHQSDVYIVSPVHFQDRLVAWSATFVHVTDIGAMSPGGNSPGATEIFHEGIRIPGIKLIERGKVRRDVLDAITNMTRQPALVELDLKGEIGANNVARARIQEVYEHYGPEVVDAVSAEMIHYTERILRKRLLELLDGSWRATAAIQSSNVVLKLTKTGEHLLFDFTGTDPQAKVGINLPYHATFGKCFAAVVKLLGWDLPKNQGAFGFIEVVAPAGTLVNVQSPGPVSLNTTSGGPLVEHVADGVVAQMVARSERWGAEVIAKSEGFGNVNVRHAGVNQHGWYYVAASGGLGGSGARTHGDGVDSAGGGLMIDHNVEWFESMYPFVYLFRRQVTDGGGAGKFRGGVGQEWAITLHDAPEGRIKCVGYGVPPAPGAPQRSFLGGYPAAPSRTVVRTKGTRVNELLAQKTPPVDLKALGGEEAPAPYAEFELRPGEVLIKSGGGGRGYGDPLERDPLAVANDVVQGLVSVEAARNVYGVVMTGPSLDPNATELARSRLREERSEHLEPRAARPTNTDDVSGQTKDGSGQPGPLDHPLPENLRVAAHLGTPWVCCARCNQPLCPEGEDWTEPCNRKRLPPTLAGASMEPLAGSFVLEQLYCPSCAALFVTEIVEA